MASKKTLLIDFDGTLARYDGWKGLDVVGDPLHKARHAMLVLAKKYRLVCFTTRATNVSLIEEWLRHWGFPKMKVTNIKEPAFLIIDDRAIRFEGVWSDEFINQIDSFCPHWQSLPDNDSQEVKEGDYDAQGLDNDQSTNPISDQPLKSS